MSDDVAQVNVAELMGRARKAEIQLEMMGTLLKEACDQRDYFHGRGDALKARVKLLEHLCMYALSEEGPEVCFSEKLRAQLTAGARGEEIPE